MPARRFQPLKAKDSQTDQAYSEISQVIDALAPLELYPLRTDARVHVASGSCVRLGPRSAGQEVTIPEATGNNFGQTITLFVQNALGSVRVRATAGTINGATAFTLAAGYTTVVVLRSGGDGKWMTERASGFPVAGNGLSYDGDTLNIGAGAGITVNADDVAVDQSFSPTWTGSHSFTGALHTVDVTGAVAIDGDDFTVNAVDDVFITSGDIVQLNGSTRVRFLTAAVLRLEIENDGAWQIAGSTGTTGQILTSQGSAASPTWSTLPAAADTTAGVIETATQAEQAAASSTAVAVTPGRQHLHPSAAKGWCRVSGTTTIDDSYNVSSVTHPSTGRVDCNWDTDLSSVSCGFVQVHTNSAVTDVCRILSQSNSVLIGRCWRSDTGTLVDPTIWDFLVFGDM